MIYQSAVKLLGEIFTILLLQDGDEVVALLPLKGRVQVANAC